MQMISAHANSSLMDGLEQDRALVRALVEWSGKKPSPLATDAGMAATTLTRTFKGEATSRMSRATVERLRQAYPDFPGWKAEKPVTNAQPFMLEGASLIDPTHDLPVFGTALGAAREVEGEAIEQTYMNSGEVVEYIARPPLLNRAKKAYALYVQGSSMHPALPDGELVAVTRGGPVAIGDNVVVHLRPTDHQDDGERTRGVLVKELVRRTASYVELRQYSPAKDFRIDMAEVLHIDRVLTRRDMLS